MLDPNLLWEEPSNLKSAKLHDYLLSWKSGLHTPGENLDFCVKGYVSITHVVHGIFSRWKHKEMHTKHLKSTDFLALLLRKEIIHLVDTCIMKSLTLISKVLQVEFMYFKESSRDGSTSKSCHQHIMHLTPQQWMVLEKHWKYDSPHWWGELLFDAYLFSYIHSEMGTSPLCFSHYCLFQDEHILFTATVNMFKLL
jgi:hypothetical protein